MLLGAVAFVLGRDLALTDVIIGVLWNVCLCLVACDVAACLAERVVKSGEALRSISSFS